MANCFILLVSTKKQYFDLDNFKIFPETHTCFWGRINVNKCFIEMCYSLWLSWYWFRAYGSKFNLRFYSSFLEIVLKSCHLCEMIRRGEVRFFISLKEWMHWIGRFWDAQSKILISVLPSYSAKERQSFSSLRQTCACVICLVSTEWVTESWISLPQKAKSSLIPAFFKWEKKIIIFLQSGKNNISSRS